MNKELKDRLKNPVFIMAIAGLVYQGLQQAGVKIDEGLFKTIIDLISYGVMGVGIYSTFGKKEE